MPLLGRQPAVANFLGSYIATLPVRPTAVVVVTAHWEEEVVAVSKAESPKLYFDYSGFPPESYKYEYKAPGAPALAERILSLLGAAGLKARAETKRGWDHGVFVPMKLLIPEADVPLVAVSLRAGQKAEDQVAIGRALAPLRDEGKRPLQWPCGTSRVRMRALSLASPPLGPGVLIVGSGASFHNFKYFFARDGESRSKGEAHSRTFDNWLRQAVTDRSLEPDARIRQLCAWESAPSARESQPVGGAEHLMPLFACLGAALGEAGVTVGEQDETFGSLAMSQFEWR